MLSCRGRIDEAGVAVAQTTSLRWSAAFGLGARTAAFMPLRGVTTYENVEVLSERRPLQ